ncbi:hypothetical protein niasHS_014099 [Heterodera schachtii]|uniref:Resistance to inhibitors of cholinesterase protein 3 N-terminal domain-containing protein n=1 Tax=Heterodera schachtii TaxID=97005 RepID=A0ABD2IP16_HETSC
MNETTTIPGVHNRKFANQKRRTPNTTEEEEERRKKERKRKGRRRRDTSGDSEEEADEEWHESGRREEVLPKWKLCLVGAAIFLCFALLYPSVFSPMLSNLFGGGAQRQQPAAADRPMHPSMMGPNQQQQQRERAHRPPPHHPGASMRMPDMHNQQQQQQQGGFWSGKSGGSMAWMLPFYTVGVVCFLLYTLFKSKTKRQKRRRDQPIDLLYDDDDEGTEDGLEYGVRGAKLRSVQHRLRKTEQAMADILSQLEQISAHSKDINDDDTKAAEKNVKDPNNAATAQSEEESAEKLQEKDGTLKEAQSAKVEQSLRELKMLSDLCKSDRRLRRKLRAAAQRQQNHHSSSSSSANSDNEFMDEEEEVGSEEEEEEANGYENKGEMRGGSEEDEEEEGREEQTDEEEEEKHAK